ncbi:MAG: DnaB-like helicase C-terminal domain-containing protein [Candidatus Saccharimonadaceae bacterium]
MSVKQLLTNIKEGKLGRNIGISTGMATLDSVIYGIQKKYLYTIGADTAGGKTSFAIDIFVYNLIKNAKGRPLNILYYSFEMSSDILFAKILARYIFDEYGDVITYEDILSLTKPISSENEELIRKATPWLLEIEKMVTIYDKALSPNGIYATCKQWLKQFGTFVEIAEHREDYIEHDSSAYKIAIIDHVGLISGPGSKKEKIDLAVDYFIYFRNKCNLTGVFVQQLNRNAKSMDRKTNGYELIQLDDFKDTSGTTDASEVVIALYFPYREKIARCEGYPIQNVLKKRFRLCQILKNRYGQADVNKGLLFYGEIGMFKELPKPEDIGDYEPYLTLGPDPHIADIEKIGNIEEIGENQSNVFKF